MIFLTRSKYEQRLKAAIEEALAACRAGHEEMAATVQRIAKDEITRVREAAEQSISQANARVTVVEATLCREREQYMKDMRHVMSMFLRREKTMPLPATKEEKAEAKAEAEEQKKQPQPLTDVQIAMRDANRREAARFGVSEEDADRDFEQKILKQMME